MPLEKMATPPQAPGHPGACGGPARWSHSLGDSPALHLHLWPYRSLPRVGFVWFIAVTSALIAVPLIPLIGTPVLWGLLPFMVIAVAGVWAALSRNQRDGELLEELSLWSDRIELIRHNPRAPRQEWVANPHWVSLQMFESGGPVPNYLTLKGAGREVEIGAFLTPQERDGLRRDLASALAAVR